MLKLILETLDIVWWDKWTQTNTPQKTYLAQNKTISQLQTIETYPHIKNNVS